MLKKFLVLFPQFILIFLVNKFINFLLAFHKITLMDGIIFIADQISIAPSFDTKKDAIFLKISQFFDQVILNWKLFKVIN